MTAQLSQASGPNARSCPHCEDQAIERQLMRWPKAGVFFPRPPPLPNTLSSLCRASSLGYSRSMHYAVMNSPMGPLTVAATEKGIASIQFGQRSRGCRCRSLGQSENCGTAHGVLPGKKDSLRSPARCPRYPVPKSRLERTAPDSLWRNPVLRRYREGHRKPGAARAVGMANHDNPLQLSSPVTGSSDRTVHSPDMPAVPS